MKLLLAHKLSALAGAAVVATATTTAAAAGVLPIVSSEPLEESIDQGESSDLLLDGDGTDSTDDTTIDDISDDTTSDDTTTDDDVLESTLDDGAGPDDLVEDESIVPTLSDGKAYGEVGCDGNHGQYVSSVARDDSIEGPRGRIVSEAARLPCGKPDGDEPVEPETELIGEEDSGTAVSEATSTPDRPDKADKADKGNGRGNGGRTR